MLDARGLVTYVITYHQHVLMLALLVAAGCTAPFVLFGARSRTGLERTFLSLAFFCGATLIAHVAVSRALGHDAIDVETIRLQAVKDDGGLATPPKK